MTAVEQSEARREWREAWPLPFVGMLGNSGASIFIYSSGVFMAAVTADFGWSRTEFTAGLTFSMILTLLAVPLVGLLSDRIGPRLVALIGFPIFVVALSSLGLANGSLWMWWAQCIVYALLATFLSPVVWASAVASRFDATRGLALAITLSGIGFAAAVYPLLAAVYIAQFGWRLAYPALALTWAVPMLPLIYFFFFSARDIGPREARPAAPRLPIIAYLHALRSRAFLTLLASGCLFSLIMLALMINLPPILTAKGIAPTSAAGIAGVAGLFAILGRVIAGYLIDRFSARVVGAIAFLLPLGTCYLLLYGSDSIALALIAAALTGLANGAELDIVSYLVSRYFGTKSFGGVYGVLVAAMGVTAGLGPTIAAWMVDRSGGYDNVLMIITPFFVLGALLIATLPKPPVHEASH